MLIEYENICDRVLDIYRNDSNFIFAHIISGENQTPITYKKLISQSLVYKEKYISTGLRPGDTIAIIAKHGPDLFYSFLGALFAGLIPSFLAFPSIKQDKERYWESCDSQLSLSATKTIVTYKENTADLKKYINQKHYQFIIIEDILKPKAQPKVKILHHQIATLQYSSGTTGHKKGIILTHKAIISQCNSYATAIDLNDQDRIISWLPLYHDMGLITTFFIPLITKTTVVYIDPFEWVIRPTCLFDMIEKFKGTLNWQPNFAFNHLCRFYNDEQKWNLSSMKAFINCSEPCKAETFQKFEKKFHNCGLTQTSLHTCYAMAENVFAVAQSSLQRPPSIFIPNAIEKKYLTKIKNYKIAQSYLSNGKVIDECAVKIVDANNRQQDEMVIGEICIKGSFNGYYKNPELSSKVLKDEWYHSGDLGFIHKKELYITGRKDDLFIINGKNFYAHNIEDGLNNLSGLKPGRNVVTSLYDKYFGVNTAIIIAEKSNLFVEEKAVLKSIRKYLNDFHSITISRIKLVEDKWLVKTTSGKINRKANLEKYLNEL